MRYVTSVERFCIEKGIQQGIEQGIERGRLEGEARVLARLLARRFGPLPEAVRRRLESADEAQLEAWSDAVLDADSLDAVFAVPPAGR